MTAIGKSQFPLSQPIQVAGAPEFFLSPPTQAVPRRLPSASVMDVSRIDVNGSPNQVLGALLKRNRGVMFGDIHGNAKVLDTMSMFLPHLASSGAKVFFVEMIKSADQAVLDRFMQTGDVSALAKHLIATGWDKGNDGRWATQLASVLNNARKLGMKLVGIDVKNTGNSRLESSNTPWASKIEETMRTMPREAKCVLFGGLGHSANYQFNKGVDALLGIPSIDFVSSREPDISRQAAGTGVGRFALSDGRASTMTFRVE